MSSTKNTNDTHFLAELEELKHSFLTMKENSDKAVTTLKEQNKKLVERIVLLETSHEKQQERLDVLERENLELRKKKAEFKDSESISHQEQDHNDHNDTKELENHPTKKNYSFVSTRDHNYDASFSSLTDDVLYHIVEFVGKKCYFPFGLLDKRCNRIFNEYNLPKVTFLYGIAPLDVIIQKYLQYVLEASEDREYSHEYRMISHRFGMKLGVVKYNRRDLLNWTIKRGEKKILSDICGSAALDSRLDILREIFYNSNMKLLRKLQNASAIMCPYAARCELKVLKWLRSHGCQWDYCLFEQAVNGGREDMIRWLMENGCHTVGTDSESENSDY